ncbi:DUF835 domain-containing protein [Thermococcus sp. M36]|uniref:DUF835 domain-containing protein n=1 Tax=Thermococcus sp. M36 TaxID=1638261 RepID=UPI0014389286|nr:DUF835 domain-containing protein [Thermococcus sp. M36]NJE05484.1 DUF835 domain-containing protein [Thermococcus sp. M36]
MKQPTKLHVILESAVGFLRGGGKVVVIDCLEVLVIYNDFVSVFRFLASLKDYAVNFHSLVLVTVEEGALADREFRILSKEFIPVKNLSSLLRTSS